MFKLKIINELNQIAGSKCNEQQHNTPIKIHVKAKPKLDAALFDMLSYLGGLVNLEDTSNYLAYIPVYSGYLLSDYRKVVRTLTDFNYLDEYSMASITSIRSVNENNQHCIMLSLFSPALVSIHNALSFGSTGTSYVPTLLLTCKKPTSYTVDNVRKSLYNLNVLPSLNIDHIKIS